MDPAHPPLPTAWNLLFQLATGIQTSILISESLDGFNVAATLQNSGSCLNVAFCCAAPRPEGGNENSPADTVRASVMVVPGRASDARLSQLTAPTAYGLEPSTTSNIAKPKATLRKFICNS